MIVHGQTHGGIAQGVGQALWEQCYIDPSSGQPLTGSFMDYGMPHAHTLPSFKAEIVEVLSPTNPLGIKAGGEGGTTPALAVIVSAIVDALQRLRHPRHPDAGDAVHDLAGDPERQGGDERDVPSSLPRRGRVARVARRVGWRCTIMANAGRETLAQDDDAARGEGVGSPSLMAGARLSLSPTSAAQGFHRGFCLPQTSSRCRDRRRPAQFRRPSSAR